MSAVIDVSDGVFCEVLEPAWSLFNSFDKTLSWCWWIGDVKDFQLLGNKEEKLVRYCNARISSFCPERDAQSLKESYDTHFYFCNHKIFKSTRLYVCSRVAECESPIFILHAAFLKEIF